MGLAEDFQTKLGELSAAITDIADDITQLLAAVVPAGGLTDAEATSLLADLTTKVDALKAAAAQYPAPPPTP